MAEQADYPVNKVEFLLKSYPIARDFRIELYKVYLLVFFFDQISDSPQIKNFKSGSFIDTQEFESIVSYEDISSVVAQYQNSGLFMPSTKEVAQDLLIDNDIIDEYYNKG
jgi:hypothetical protein